MKQAKRILSKGTILALMLVALFAGMMALPATPAQAATTTPSVNVTMEFVYDEGQDLPAIPATVTRFGRVYGLVSQDAPVKVSDQSTQSTFTVPNGFTEAQLNQWVKDLGLPGEVPAALAAAGPKDFPVTVERVVPKTYYDIPTNDVDSLAGYVDDHIATLSLPVGTEMPDGTKLAAGETEFTDLVREFVGSSIPNGGITLEKTGSARTDGRPSLVGDTYKATVLYRGTGTVMGWESLTVTYDDGAVIGRYVIRAYYEPLTAGTETVYEYISGAAPVAVAPAAAGPAAPAAADVTIPDAAAPLAAGPDATPAATTGTDTAATGTATTTIDEGDTPLAANINASNAVNVPWWVWAVAAVVVIAVIAAFIIRRRQNANDKTEA